jgi:hypothetical protein
MSCAFTCSLKGAVVISRFDDEAFDLAQLLLLLRAPAELMRKLSWRL